MFYVEEGEDLRRASQGGLSTTNVTFYSDLKHELLKREQKRLRQMGSAVEVESTNVCASPDDRKLSASIDRDVAGDDKWAHSENSRQCIPVDDDCLIATCISGQRSKEISEAMATVSGSKPKDLKKRTKKIAKLTTKFKSKKDSYVTRQRATSEEIKNSKFHDDRPLKATTLYNYDEFQTEKIQIITKSLAMLSSKQLRHVRRRSIDGDDARIISEDPSPVYPVKTLSMTRSVFADIPSEISSAQFPVVRKRKSSSMTESELKSVMISARVKQPCGEIDQQAPVTKTVDCATAVTR